MRTTLTIDDDVLAAAKAIAARRHKTSGEIISELARQALQPAPSTDTVRNGIPLLAINAISTPVTLDFVNQLRDELPE